ncbi:MAG: diaminopimelate decarboxylase, partial [Thermodesulfobacteriota bacterium]|nr:diaminopimelate decarboxylase [Thermodesulfobacteriota bacterium]
LKAGIRPGNIVYSGVGKTTKEIDMALDAEIMMFNCESASELEAINHRAGILGKKAPIAIRVNPDVDAQTHPYISTGMKDNKFGIDIEGSLKAYLHADRMEHVDIVGIDCHIGSQLTQMAPFVDAIERLKHLIKRLNEHGMTFKYLDMGGGLGITYNDETPPDPGVYGRTIKEAAETMGLRLIFEPGRVIVGNAGILVSEVLYKKPTPEKTFVIVDAGMNDLIRPSLYNAYHEILPLRHKEGDIQRVDIVGPICESSDFLAKAREIETLSRGDRIAVMSAGAYGFTMASTYNSRPLPPEILVDGDHYNVIRSRLDYDALVSGEIIPDTVL